MISNISNALPVLLKKMHNGENIDEINFNLVESINFYSSILPKDKELYGLKHIFLDCVFTLNEKYHDLISSFQMTLDTLPFLKDFEYIILKERNIIVIRSSCEDLSVFSLIILGAVKNLPDDNKNKGIFVSLAMNYLKYCVQSGYKVCDIEDLKALEKYNEGFDREVFEEIGFAPTSERDVGTIHFVGIELNKDILKIFETYKDIKFTYNEENASFIISMKSKYWDDFWQSAPKYLKDEFATEKSESRVNIL